MYKSMSYALGDKFIILHKLVKTLTTFCFIIAKDILVEIATNNNVMRTLKTSFFSGSFCCCLSVSICLIRIIALRPLVLQFHLPALLLVCVLLVLIVLIVVVLSGEPRQKQGRGLVDRKLVQAPQ